MSFPEPPTNLHMRCAIVFINMLRINDSVTNQIANQTQFLRQKVVKKFCKQCHAISVWVFGSFVPPSISWYFCLGQIITICNTITFGIFYYDQINSQFSTTYWNVKIHVLLQIYWFRNNQGLFIENYLLVCHFIQFCI